LLQGEGVLRSTTDLDPVDLAAMDSAADLAGHGNANSVREPDVHTDGIRTLRPVVRRDHTGPPLQLVTAKGFEWTDAQLPIPGLPSELDGFRILHLSDLHVRRYWDMAYDDVISRVKAHPPDLVVITGDFVEDKHDHRRELPHIRRFINALPSRLGTVAILGNHDGDLMGLPLSTLNMTMVDHRRLTLRCGSATLELIGIAGVEREDFDPAFLHSLGPKPPGTIRILLSHYPDLIRYSGFLNADLYMTGHTHGGQICFPGRIPVIRHDSLPAKFIGGINRFGDSWLVVNRGLGFSYVPVRLFCPAEVIEIHLRKAGGT
jgi:predicted MPP superfamily phosphohydrolase